MNEIVFDKIIESPEYIIWLKNGLCIEVNFNKHNIKISKKVE